MQHSPWDEHHIDHLLALDRLGPGRWRTRHGDANLNGRSYGGQLLGQAMMAALLEVPDGRTPTMMQFLFMQGAIPEQTLDLQVTPLQDGKRFSSRHVRAAQEGGRTVLDAQVTCAVPIDSPSHAEPGTSPEGERPEELPGLDDIDPLLLGPLARLGGYSTDRKPSIEFRIPDPHQQLSRATMNGRFRFWIRAAQPLPAGPGIHAAAFAYLSDWWANFCILGLHLRHMGERRLYISSLNHAIWFHQSFRADQWLHLDSMSPYSGSGRGLAICAVHDGQGRHVASVTQECLMGYAD